MIVASMPSTKDRGRFPSQLLFFSKNQYSNYKNSKDKNKTNQNCFKPKQQLNTA